MIGIKYLGSTSIPSCRNTYKSDYKLPLEVLNYKIPLEGTVIMHRQHLERDIYTENIVNTRVKCDDDELT